MPALLEKLESKPNQTGGSFAENGAPGLSTVEPNRTRRACLKNLGLGLDFADNNAE